MSKMDQARIDIGAGQLRKVSIQKRIIALHLILVVHPQKPHFEVWIMAFNPLPPLDGAENREGRGHGIGCGGVRCHHGHQRSRRQPHARAGVQDVGLALSIDFHKLEQIT